MPYDTALAEAMRGALQGRGGITEKKMFGGVCWMLHGNMLCGVEVGRYMFRVGAESESEALAKAGAAPMDITGRRDARPCVGRRKGCERLFADAVDRIG